jgi:proline iminopeptidase
MLDLARDHELFLYDQRGGGQSRTDDPAPITWQTHVEDAAAIARELGFDQLEIVGYSWGGLLAMLVAIEAADGSSAHLAFPPIKSLILIDPAPVNREQRGEFEREFTARQQGPVIQRMRAELAESGLRESDPAAYKQRSFELSVAGYFADPTRARDLTPFRVVGRVQQSVWASLGDFDLRPALAKLDLPALVIHGRQDPIPLASSESVAQALGARLVVLENCGHVPYVEQPQSLFDAVRRFLTEPSPLRRGHSP